MYYKRKIESTILHNLKNKEILAIIGARQCGKTTTLKTIADTLPDSIWLSFENRAVLQMFEKDPDQFYEQYCKGKSVIFIDEFQYSKHGGQRLKYLYDTWTPKFVITGSSAIDLTVRALKYLVGRILVFEMFPFDWEEFICARLEKNFIEAVAIDESVLRNLLQEFIIFGGYPRVISAQDETEKKLILQNIYDTYFLREVKDIFGLIDDEKLEKLINIVGLQIGNLTNYDEWGTASGFGHVAIKKYLRFLEKTFIAEQIKPYFTNRQREIVKNPKWYFFDSGIRNIVVNDFRWLQDREDGGALLENFFFTECRKRKVKIQYWRTKLKEEVDFVISQGRGTETAFEIKISEPNEPIPSVKKFIALHPLIPVSVVALNILSKPQQHQYQTISLIVWLNKI